MRPDLLQARKTIHIALPKEVHAGLKTVLFKYGLSMQEAIGEFARLIACNDKQAIRVIEELVRIQLEEIKDGLRKKNGDRSSNLNKKIGELDQETLYDMINNIRENNETTRDDS